MARIEEIKSALNKVEAQQDNFGFMDRFDVPEHWAVRKSLEKQIPLKPKMVKNPDPIIKRNGFWWVCGNCEANQHTSCRNNYCSYCGQRVDWSEYLQNSKYPVPDDIMEHSKIVFPELKEGEE